jgi:hypothetical protein
VAADRTATLIAKVKRAADERDKVGRLADKARAAYRHAIVVALDGGVSQSRLARELETSTSRIREEAIRGRSEMIR